MRFGEYAVQTVSLEEEMSRRVVVTGMGAITPLGLSVEEFWNGVKEGKIGFGIRHQPALFIR